MVAAVGGADGLSVGLRVGPGVGLAATGLGVTAGGLVAVAAFGATGALVARGGWGVDGGLGVDGDLGTTLPPALNMQS